jgi:hypothetical protein
LRRIAPCASVLNMHHDGSHHDSSSHDRPFTAFSAKKLLLAILACVPLIAFTLLAAPAKRIHLVPKFVAGDTLRFQIETRTATKATTTTPIANPEGGSEWKQSASMIVRLDVLDVRPGAAGAAGPIHLRATYEKSAATSQSDAYDPQAAALEEQYNRLEGRSLEFTIEPDGKFSGINGFEDLLANPSAAGAARSWMSGLSSGVGFPKQGIEIGKKWTREQPFIGTPLAGLVSRTESSYLRDEPCRAPDTAAAASAQSASGASNDICAVILTRFEILHHGPANGETPEDYRRNGLRTSGTWLGSGQSLDSISLASGFLVSSTQTSSQNMNFEIVSATSGSKFRYSGKTETQTQIVLLSPQAPAAPRASEQKQP